jgi:hypothetical protein
MHDIVIGKIHIPPSGKTFAIWQRGTKRSIKCVVHSSCEWYPGKLVADQMVQLRGKNCGAFFSVYEAIPHRSWSELDVEGASAAELPAPR